jgi:SAM-dependent methyltransferase
MSFDSLAPHYAWMEFFLAGEKLQRCRTAFLSEARTAQNVLILGEGNGRFLVECRRSLASARITCVDASAPMLNLAQKRVERLGLNQGKLEFVQADALSWTPPEAQFDLIVTHFFLDCFCAPQLASLIEKLSQAATLRATWLLADFQIPAAGFRRHRAKVIHFLMYSFFRLAARLPARSLTPADDFLGMHGFVLRKRIVTEWGLLHTDYWKRDA